MKIEKLQPGQVVYSVERRNMGTRKTVSVLPVRIVEIDPEKQWVLASLNNNPSRKYSSRSFSKWRAKKPVMISTLFGYERLATREEIKAMKEKEASE
jgi:hypothetical protein